MQFMLLIHLGDTPLPNTPQWDALPSDEQQAVYADYAALNAMDGLTPGLPLGLAARATTVRVEHGATVTTDGPAGGEPGGIGGYYLLDADDVQAAVEVAARIPAARMGGAIEIRPIEARW